MIPAPEKDPNGVNQHDAGAKLDEGKLRYSLIPPGPLRWLAALYTKGAAKYSAQGWKSVKNGEERYLDALIRHLEAYRSNEWLDPDTQVPHIIGVAWNAFAICFYRESYMIKPHRESYISKPQIPSIQQDDFHDFRTKLFDMSRMEF